MALDRIFGPRARTVHRLEKRLTALEDQLLRLDRRLNGEGKSVRSGLETLLAAEREAASGRETTDAHLRTIKTRLGEATQAVGVATEELRAVAKRVVQIEKRVADAGETAVSLKERTGKLHERITEVDARFGHLEKGIKSMRGGIGDVLAEQRHAHVRLATMEDQFTRFHRRLQMVLRRQYGGRESAQAGGDGAAAQSLFGGPFLVAATPVVETQRTLLGYDRLYVLWQAVMNTARLGLPVAEVGSYKGGSAYFLASALREAGCPDTPLHVFDTFAGHPASKTSPVDQEHEAGLFDDANADDVRAYLSAFGNAQVHVGEFTERSSAIADDRFALVHVDVDTYVSTTDCLEFFTPRLAAGGVLVLDDFRSEKCPGVAQAVGEFADLEREYQVWDVSTEQLVLLRR